MKKVGIGFVGCGAISDIYFRNIARRFREMEIVGACDLLSNRVEWAAKAYHVPRIYGGLDEILADPAVDIILNITRPAQHRDVTMAALNEGKHVYSEKPLAASVAEAEEIMALAKEKGLMVGCGPDTFLGAGFQTSRELVDSGAIGDVIGCAGFMINHGHESWHPDPEFYYKYGGGPMLDMGPYYVTALINLCGNVEAVSAMTHTTFSQRTITSQPHQGQKISVEVPTLYAGTMRFTSGAVGTLYTTFDVHYPEQSRLEIYGTKGTLFVPDPNTFGGPVRMYTPEEGMEEVALRYDYAENCRALGLADMAKALQCGRPFRASADQAFHVLEIMEGFDISGRERREIDIRSRFERQPPMKKGLEHGILDAAY